MTPNWPVVTLFNDSETAIETIVGSPGIGPDGQLTAIPGPLIKAIMDKNAGMNIRDPPKNDCKFDSWIATVITDKRLPFNGTSVIIPDDFQIIFATGIPEIEFIQLRQRTVSRWNGQICDLMLTTDTVHLQYHTVHIGSVHIVHLTPGLSGTKIKIVGPRSTSEWLKLLHHLPKTAEVTISNSTHNHFLQYVGITVHHDYHPDTERTAISSDISYTPGAHGIHTTEPDFTLHRMQGVPDSRFIIDISTAMDTDAPFQSVTMH